MRFQAIWGEKWTKNLTKEIAPIALAEWSDGLRGFNQEELNYALEMAKNTLEWPPSIAEFRAMAKARHGSCRDTRTPGIEGKPEYYPPSPILQEYMNAHPETHSAEGIVNAKDWLAKIRGILDKKEKVREIDPHYTS